MAEISIRRLRLRTEGDLRNITESWQPVIIEGLFDGQRASEIRSFDRMAKLFGHLPVEVRYRNTGIFFDNYRKFAQTQRVLTRSDYEFYRQTTLRDYIDNADRDWSVAEMGAAEELLPLLGMPEWFAELGISRLVSDYFPDRDAAGCVWFMAKQGAVTDLHTDWDGHHGLHYHLLGRKRWTVFPPSSGPKLGAADIWGTVQLQKMDTAERREFLRYAGGVECEAGPGDTIYVPPFYYHLVEYPSDALGIALRFFPLAPDVAFCIQNLHRSNSLQALYAMVVRYPTAALSQQVAASLKQACLRPYRNMLEKYHAVERLAESLCEEHGLLRNRWQPNAQLFLVPLLSAQYYMYPPEDWGWIKKQWWLLKNRMACRRWCM